MAPAFAITHVMEGIHLQQIIAMGGGGFSMEPENPLLDEYVLRQTGRDRPRVLFLPTASGDAEGYVETFHTAFAALGCDTEHLSLFRPPEENLQSVLMRQDVIYVGGGNTFNMLALWRLWGLDAALRAAWENGVVLAGLSAGAICWFESGLTDSFPGEFRPLGCLGYLPGSLSPHYDGEPERRPTFHRLLAAGEIGPGYAADDGVALHFKGRDLHAAVSSRPEATAYHLDLAGSKVVEAPVETRYLG